MIVEVDNDGVRVREAENLRQLHIETTREPAEVRESLRRSGLAADVPDDRDDAHVWLDLRALREIAHRSGGAQVLEWDSSWQGMVDYAQKQGWVRDDQSVRVHVERPPIS